MSIPYPLASTDGNPMSLRNRSIQVSSAFNHTGQHEGEGVPVIGLPGPLFTVIHVSALTTLSVSTVVTILLLFYLCCCRASVRSRAGPTINQKTIITRVLAQSSTVGGKRLEGETGRVKSGGEAIGSRRVEEEGKVAETAEGGTGGRIEGGETVGAESGEGRRAGRKRGIGEERVEEQREGKVRQKTVRDVGGIEVRKIGGTEKEDGTLKKTGIVESRERADEEIGNGIKEEEREGEGGKEERRESNDRLVNSRRNQIPSMRKNTSISFWNWTTGERFVIYLGICDLCQGVSHFFDHAYIFYTKDNPPDLICAVFAFFLHEFTFAQWFVILATAVSACSLVVFGRKIHFGRFDWRLIAFAFGLPTLLGVITLSLGLLGANGAWCFINMGSASGRIYAEIVTLIQICAFGLIGVAYGAIWLRIQRTTKLMKGSTTERYQSSAKVMMVFVAAFILQWWSLILFNVWILFATPHSAVLVLAVIIINLGGVYNCIAYTVIRRRIQRQRINNPIKGAVVMGTHQSKASSRCGLGVSNEISLTPDNATVSQSLTDDPEKALPESIRTLQNTPSYTEIHM